MAFSLSLGTLSINEKLLLMETLWEDLSRQALNIDVTDWHQDVLLSREKPVADQQSRFIDWDEAKQNLRQTLK